MKLHSAKENPSLLLGLASQALRGRDYQGALAYYSKALQRYPKLEYTIKSLISFTKKAEIREGLEIRRELNNCSGPQDVSDLNYSLPSPHVTHTSTTIDESRYKHSISDEISNHCTQQTDTEIGFPKNGNILTISAQFEELYINNFELNASGIMINAHYPEVPPRYTVRINDRIVCDGIAIREITQNQISNFKQYGFSFNCTLLHPEIDHTLELVNNNQVTIGFIRIDSIFRHCQFPVNDKELSVQESYKPKVDHIPDVVGNVESISRHSITGWAYDKNDKEAQVQLSLYINNKLISTIKTNQYRQDVESAHKCNPFSGFHFEVPNAFEKAKDLQIRIESDKGNSQIKKSHAVLPKISSFMHDSIISPSLEYNIKSTTDLSDSIISIIVITRDGCEILDDMLSSSVKFFSKHRVEWIIIDHNSSDGTEELCNKYVAYGFDLTFVQRGANYSFSNSNNLGASLAKGDILLFANNDIIFTSDVIQDLKDILSDNAIGIVGFQLRDHSFYKNEFETLAIQHLGVFVDTNLHGGFVRPYEARAGTTNTFLENSTHNVFAVTGALLGIKQRHFQEIGGFDNRFDYGLEDVDLCLKSWMINNQKIILSSRSNAIHHRAFSRGKDTQGAIRRKSNNMHFTRKWAKAIRSILRDRVCDTFYRLSGRSLTIAFAVTSAGDKTSAGEYYTASELGNALQKAGAFNVRYLTEEEWYDLEGIDILVTMVNRFNLHKVKRLSPYLITINWCRQWFDRWANDKTIYSYDLILASSDNACEYLNHKTGVNAYCMPIATNFEVFSNGRANSDFDSDLVFTGSKFNIGREIEYQLKPGDLQAKCVIYGYNWEGTLFEEFSRGPVAYSQLPDLYASTKIVIDDANIATKEWGSCNSRVFDSLAAGCLLISNGSIGVNALFGGIVPTFHDSESLLSQITYWLSNEDKRFELTKRLQSLVKAEHSYAKRADQLIALLNEHFSSENKRIAIKCAAKTDQKDVWGDYFYAQSLAKSLRKKGFVVRVDCREDWEMPLSTRDDVVIVLRGLLNYNPKPSQINLMWLISHPDLCSVHEFNSYDHVFVASQHYASKVESLIKPKVSVLAQCFDKTLFYPCINNNSTLRNKILFVGNSRGVFRESVKFGILSGCDLDIYGMGWEGFIDSQYIKGQRVPNDSLRYFYSNYGIVLCDHWEDMKENGFISNRIYDVMACNGSILTDNVVGLDKIEYPNLYKYHSYDDFKAIISNLPKRNIIKNDMIDEYSFDAASARIHEVILKLSSLGECLHEV